MRCWDFLWKKYSSKTYHFYKFHINSILHWDKIRINPAHFIWFDVMVHIHSVLLQQQGCGLIDLLHHPIVGNVSVRDLLEWKVGYAATGPV